jgi:hypothetical protein
VFLLNDDLSDFARAIVRGEEPSSRIDTSSQNYSVAIAIEVYRNNYCGNLHYSGAEMAGFIVAFDSAQGLLGEASATTLAHLFRFRFTSLAAEAGCVKRF